MLFFYLLWKRKKRKGWHGTLIGVAVCFLIQFGVGLIGAMMRHS